MPSDPTTPEPPLVGLMLLDDFPEGLENEAKDFLANVGIDLAVDRRENTPFAGLELYLPTAAVLFVAAGFFNGVLTKAGEDSYDAVKKAVLDIWRKTRHVKVTTVSTTGKLASDQRYSLTYSLVGQYAPGLSFKLLLQTDVSEADVAAGTVTFLKMIDDLLNDRVSEADCKILLTYQPVGGTVLVTFDAVAGKIIPVNGLEGAGPPT